MLTDETAIFAESTSEWEIDSYESIEDVIRRTESTLDLIADAIVSASEIRPLNRYDISIIIPVYNERETLPKVLERIDQVMPPSTETIIVDDGSTDGTRQWLLSLPQRANRKTICRKRNHGKGSSLRLGIRHSRGGVVAIQDADLEYDPVNLLRIIWPILDGDADVVYGSRYLGHHSNPSLVHRIGNWMLTKASNTMTGLQLSDMETCHKAFDGDLIRSIELKECRFGFEPEITAKIAARDVAIVEVPTQYEGRGYADGKKIGWRDAISTLACMWRYRHGEKA